MTHHRCFGTAVVVAVLLALASGQCAHAADEHIDVQGIRNRPVASYRDVAKLFRAFNELRPKARAGLSLHLVGSINPGDGLPSAAHLTLRAHQGNIVLYEGSDRDMHFPLTDALWDENPKIYDSLPPDRTLVTELVMKVDLPDRTVGFTTENARFWMGQIDACIENVVGVVFSWLMPDAHRLRVEIPPGARLEAVSGKTVELLLDNRSSGPQTFEIRAQDYPDGTLFRSTLPFGWVSVVVPGKPHFTFTPDK